MQRVKGPEDLADSVIFLPSRRLAYSLKQAFLEHNKGKAQLLPRFLPIGDVEEDIAELAIAGWDKDDLPPPVLMLERQLLFASALQKLGRNTAETLALAKALGDFLDSAQMADCDFDDLKNLTDGDYAHHWEQLLELLNLLMKWWPLKLKEIGRADRITWRNAAMEATAQAWQVSPPRGLVVVAGSTGSLKATRTLMRAALNLERGYVVLPGLDKDTADEDWATLISDEEEDVSAICHPQYQLARLLEEFEIERQEVKLWLEESTTQEARLALLRELFRPASRTTAWQGIPKRSAIRPEALEGLEVIDCYDQREEAEVIALAMREVLETPKRTAVLITADRALARRVSGELWRWGIEVSDSGGLTLNETPPAQFLCLLADAWLTDFAPLELLALLQHHLACGGMDKQNFRTMVRALDKKFLRGTRPEGGLDGLVKKIASKDKDFANRIKKHVLAPLSPLLKLDKNKRYPLAEIIEVLGQAGEDLAATSANPIALWDGRAGMRVARFIGNLKEGAESSGTQVEGHETSTLLPLLLKTETIYPDLASHPRLGIMGSVEGRMQSADLIILGGMNEGSMPPRTAADPWMSNAMRLEFGLPPSNWRVGLAAHDAWMAMAKGEVLITRAARVDGAEAEKSRWLRRLDAVLEVASLTMPARNTLPNIATRMNSAKGDLKPINQPAPMVKKEDRPTNLSATKLDILIKDPYAIYAEKVLGLRALDPIDAPPSAADKGTAIHNVLATFTKKFADSPLPDDALEQLLAIGKEEFAKLPQDISIEIFWQPHFEAIAKWFIETETARQNEIKERHAEIRGEILIEGYTITARADRIDVLADNSLRIIDYKTGSVPSARAVKEGQALQLACEAVLAHQGGFPNIEEAKTLHALEYWRLSGRNNTAGEILNRSIPIEQAEEYLSSLLAKFSKDDARYESEIVERESAHRYSDYRHLARVREWRLLGDKEEEDAG